MNNAKNCLNLPQLEMILDSLADYHAFGHGFFMEMGKEKFFQEFPIIFQSAMFGIFMTSNPDTNQYMTDIFMGMNRNAIKSMKQDLGIHNHLN